MAKKGFLLRVELEILSINSPGTWLCADGNVCLHIYMLNSCAQTKFRPPTFPVRINECFIFSKVFDSNHRLINLQNEIRNESFYIEFIQSKDKKTGTILAKFNINLDDLLYPKTSCSTIPGIDIDLLMETMPLYPGKIAPKIECSTKTTIEETICYCPRESNSLKIVNPKILTSLSATPKFPIQRIVCHSVDYSRKKKKTHKKPPVPFVCRKVDNNLFETSLQDLPTNMSTQPTLRQRNHGRKPNVKSIVVAPNKTENSDEICKCSLEKIREEENCSNIVSLIPCDCSVTEPICDDEEEKTVTQRSGLYRFLRTCEILKNYDDCYKGDIKESLSPEMCCQCCNLKITPEGPRSSVGEQLHNKLINVLCKAETL